MKKTFTLFLAIIFCAVAGAQTYKYYLDNNLPFKNAANQSVGFPFTGGFLSPQFSNIDLNNDGIKDLFVFDKGGNKVLTYLHSGVQGAESWIYAPQYEFFFPRMYSWALLVDYNNDGKEDIFTMANPYYYPQAVAVYKNTSTGGKLSFTLVKDHLIADPNDVNQLYPDIFWVTDDISAISDVDGDGDVDILSFGPSGVTITMYENESVEKGYPLDSLVFRIVDDCWGGFQESFVSRDITLGAPCFGSKYYTSTAGHAGSTMLLIDMDNDNDKDLILGDVSYPEFTLLTNGKKDFAWPYDSMSAYDTVFPRNTTKANVYTFPAAFYVDVNNNGIKDLVVAPNLKAGGKSLDQILLYRNSGGNNQPSFTYTKTNFLQENTVDFGSGAAPALLDVDNDGDLDLLVAHRGEFTQTLNSADRLALFTNTGTASNPVFKLDNNPDYLGLIQDSIREMKPTFGDLNGDGKTDLLIGDADGRLRYYQNNTTGQLSFAPGVKNYMRIDIGFSAAPQLVDLDEDGLLDLIIGTGNGYINYYKNKGTATAPSFDSIPTIDTLGGVYVTDFYWHYIYDGTFEHIIDSSKVYNFNGWATPYVGDLDGDGDRELLVGSDMGKLWLFNNVDNNLNGTFTEVTDYIYNIETAAFGQANFGARIVPVIGKLSDTSDAVIIMGNFRGGINYLKPNSGVTTSVPALPEKLALSVYPNPTAGEITISRSLQQYDGRLEITVTDVLGRTLHTGRIESQAGQQTIQLNVAPGVYYVSVSNGTHFTAVEKVTVLK